MNATKVHVSRPQCSVSMVWFSAPALGSWGYFVVYSIILLGIIIRRLLQGKGFRV